MKFNTTTVNQDELLEYYRNKYLKMIIECNDEITLNYFNSKKSVFYKQGSKFFIIGIQPKEDWPIEARLVLKPIDLGVYDLNEDKRPVCTTFFYMQEKEHVENFLFREQFTVLQRAEDGLNENQNKFLQHIQQIILEETQNDEKMSEEEKQELINSLRQKYPHFDKAYKEAAREQKILVQKQKAEQRERERQEREISRQQEKERKEQEKLQLQQSKVGNKEKNKQEQEEYKLQVQQAKARMQENNLNLSDENDQETLLNHLRKELISKDWQPRMSVDKRNVVTFSTVFEKQGKKQTVALLDFTRKSEKALNKSPVLFYRREQDQFVIQSINIKGSNIVVILYPLDEDILKMNVDEKRWVLVGYPLRDYYKIAIDMNVVGKPGQPVKTN